MRATRRHRTAAAGFTVIELVIALAVMVIVIIGVLLIFDFNTRLARAQTNVAEMQQSLRVSQQSMVRTIRMAGRGGLPVGPTLPTGFAVSVRNDVGNGGGSRDIAVGFADSPQVVAGTDVLTVRGVFNTPLYQINNANPGTFVPDVDGGALIGGKLMISSTSPTGVDQSTQALIDAVDPPGDDDPVPEAMILVSPLNDAIYAVVEIDPATSNVDDHDNVTIGFKWVDGTHTDGATGYEALTGTNVFPSNLTSVAFVGILEEYRYYVREERAVPGDDTTELRPRLSRARMYPGTEVPYLAEFKDDPTENLKVDIADNILDLQVALGIDTNADGAVLDLGNQNDEWLYNSPASADNDGDPVWNQAGRRLYYLRVSTLARTERREVQYMSPRIVAIEDHAYDEPAVPADDAQRKARMFHRRVLETVVDMRNIT